MNRTKRRVIDPKLSRQHIGLMGAAPPAQSSLRYAAQLLGCILGDQTGSRLYYSLVESAIAEDASVTYDPMDGTGVLLTFLTTNPDRAEEALDTTRREFQKFLDEGPTESELTAAKNKIASGSVLKGELPMGRMTAVGLEWIYRREYTPLAEQIDNLTAVTGDQVLSVAREFALTDSTIVTLGPRESIW